MVRTGERELENRIRWKKTKGERGMEGEKRKEKKREVLASLKNFCNIILIANKQTNKHS